jgi:hypothetical protein
LLLHAECWLGLAQIRSVSFTIDSTRRPDLVQSELLPELVRLFVSHLENAEVVAEGTAALPEYGEF